MTSFALAVRWFVRYRLSYAEVSEWLAEYDTNETVGIVRGSGLSCGLR